MIEQGKYAGRYFNAKRAHKQVQYTFKSRKQYASEQKKQEKPTKQYFKSTQLESLIMDFPYSKKLVTQAAIDHGKCEHHPTQVHRLTIEQCRNGHSLTIFGLFEGNPLLRPRSKDDPSRGYATPLLSTPLSSASSSPPPAERISTDSSITILSGTRYHRSDHTYGTALRRLQTPRSPWQRWPCEWMHMPSVPTKWEPLSKPFMMEFFGGCRRLILLCTLFSSIHPSSTDRGTNQSLWLVLVV